MVSKLQEGILHDDTVTDRRPRAVRNKSFAILFLRVAEGCSAIEVGESIRKLWKMYKRLQRGRVSDLSNIDLPAGGLTVLIGYGPNIFKLREIRKSLPTDMRGRQFLPSGEGKGPILKGSGIRYAADEHENVGITEHIVVQLISDTQLSAFRGIVETWKHLGGNHSKEPVYLSKFYTGFQRDDHRSWLGFHDEVSNMTNSRERERAIVIDIVNNNLRHRDYWTKGGSYLAFIRFDINLNIWDEIDRKHQELIVGRDKLSGWPVIGVDRKLNPLTSRPDIYISPKATFRSKRFVDHPDYFKMPLAPEKVKNLDFSASIRILNQSHIGRARHIDNIDSKEPTSRRIFRQSFEFLERMHSDDNRNRPFRTGLNFVSFQNDPGRLFFILTDSNWMGNVTFGGNPDNRPLDNLISVLAAGVFFVPRPGDPFPGADIFI